STQPNHILPFFELRSRDEKSPAIAISRSKKADDGYKATGVAALCPVTEKKIRPASRTNRRDFDGAFRHPGRDEKGRVGSRQIQGGPARAGPPHRLRADLVAKPLVKLLAHRVTARLDAWPEGDLDPFGRDATRP